MESTLLEDTIDCLGANGEEPEPEEPEEDAPEEIGALYDDELEAEVVEVPGRPGCWFAFQPMGGAAFDRWAAGSTQIKLKDGKVVDAPVQVNWVKSQQDLVLGTVVDFCLVRKGTVRGGEAGETAPVEVRPPKDPIQRKTFLMGEMEHWTRPLRQWVVKEASRVNGMEEKKAKK